MSLYISTNQGAVTANYHLGRNSNALQKSMQRLASGSRINRPSDDAGGLAVSMKLQASINRLAGAEKNIQNGVSFLEVQDGILESIGTIVDRMSELKGLSRDVMKNENDQKTYNREFKDLQVQLKDMISGTFNGVSLFARYADDNTGGGIASSDEAVFDIDGAYSNLDHTVDVFTSADGSAGAKVSIHKALAWSALTFDSSKVDARSSGVRQLNYGAAYATNIADTDQLNVQVGNTVITRGANLADESIAGAGMENIAALRAQNGAAMSRLEFQQVNLSRQRTNMEAANGRIKDVDMGAETTRMAKYSVLRQASAAMLAQANSAPEVALMLLR